MKSLFFFLGLLICSLTVEAAIPKNNSALLLGSGSIRGGVADRGFGLINVKNFPGKNGRIERIVFDVGNPILQAIRGAPGYFHIENDTQAKRIVINFEQTVTSKFTEANLKKLLKKSPFIRNAEMYVDSSSQTTTIILRLNKAASLRAVPVAGRGGKTAQVNIDLFEENMIRK